MLRRLVFTCISLLLFIFKNVYCSSRPNIILFLTDDQDVTMKGLDPMVKTLNLIANQGTTMVNAFTTTPLCCPSRTSILTGLYQTNHQVANNSLPGGCSSSDWQERLEKKTFATALQKLNYSTFYAGKYLNQYGDEKVGGPKHVPPGWDWWVGLVGNSRYYNYTLSINGTARIYEEEYLTHVLGSYADDFLEQRYPQNKPFLMVIAPPAPHQPFTPEPKYRGVFQNQRVPREPNFNTANNSNKHWIVRTKPSPLPKNTIRLLDKFYASRWESLLSVDDLVEKVVQKLNRLKILDNTYIFFTSDNGYHLGQFSMPWDKRQPYDFDIRVPFLMRGPGIPKKSVSTKPVLLLDLYSTFLKIGGVEKTFTDGISALPFQSKGNRDFIVEYRGEGNGKRDAACPHLDNNLSQCTLEACCKCEDSFNNTYTCVRRLMDDLIDYMFCSFKDNEAWIEAYDLKKDPYQLNNLHSTMDWRQKSYFISLISSWTNEVDVFKGEAY